MNFSCQQIDLNEALSTVTHALSAKSPIPALECVLLRFEGNYATLICSDLHLTIECKLPAAVDEPGAVLLPGRLFTEVVRKLPEGDVSIEVSSGFGVKITAQSTRTTLAGMDPNTFPTLPQTPETASHAIVNQLSLRDMIRQTAFAVAIDETRPILTGCLMQVQGQVMTMVSLDNYRMALRRSVLSAASGDFSFVVPGRYLSEIGKILSDADDEIKLCFGGNHLLLSLGLTQIMVRLLEGDYIKYEQIIPQENALRVKIDREALLDCVDRASLIAREGKNNLIKMQITDGNMIVTSNNELGDLYEVIPIEQYGPDLSIAFNVRYVSDVLKNLTDEKVLLLLNTPVSPCTVLPETGDSFLYLLLPVRV